MPKISLDFEATDNVSDVLKKISKSMETTSVSGKKAEQGIAKVSKESVKSKGELTKFSESVTKMSEALKNTVPGSGRAAEALTKFGGGLKSLVNPATLAVAAIGVVAVSIHKLAVVGTQAWDQQTKAIQSMEGALRKAGVASETASSKLQLMAKELQSTGIFSDQNILENVTTSLLAFDAISLSAFTRVQAASLDTAAAIKGVSASSSDLQNISNTIGKALQDPIKGLDELRQVGVTFTAQERKMIKEMQSANQLSQAQEVVLSKLENRFGGMNTELSKTSIGMKLIADNKLSEAMENLGESIQPVQTALSRMAATAADLLSRLFASKDLTEKREYEVAITKANDLLAMEEKRIELSNYEIGQNKVYIRNLLRSYGVELDMNMAYKDQLALLKQIGEQKGLTSKDLPDTGGSSSGDSEWANKKKAAQDYYNRIIEQADAAQRSEKEQLQFTYEQQLLQLDEYANRKLLTEGQLKEGQLAAEYDYYNKLREIQKKEDAKVQSDKLKAHQEVLNNIAGINSQFFTESSFAEVAAIGKMSQDIVSAFQGMSRDVAKVFKDMENDAGRTSLKMEEAFSLAATGAAAALTSLSSVLSMQQSMKQASYDRQLEALREMHEEESRMLEESYERLQEDQENKDELRLAELEKYELALEDKIDNEIRYALDKKKRDLTRAAEEKALEKKKAEEQKKIDQDYEMAKYKIELDAFNSRKKSEIANVAIQTGVGIARAWAGAMLLTPNMPLVSAVGSAMTAIMLGTGGAQIAMISSQEPPPPPKFAGGVTNFEGGWAIVGERGPEMVTLPQGSNVITNENTQSLLAPIYITNDIYLDSVLIASQLVDARRSASYGGY